MESANKAEIKMAAELSMVKIVLKGLIISVPSAIGIPVQTLLKDYKELEGRAVPFAIFGFKNVFDFLHSLRDTLQVNIRDGIHYVRPIISADNAHISQLVLEQNRGNSKRRGMGGGLRRVTSIPARRNVPRRNTTTNNNQSRAQFAWPPPQPSASKPIPSNSQTLPRAQPKPSEPPRQPSNYIFGQKPVQPVYQPTINSSPLNAPQLFYQQANNTVTQSLAPMAYGYPTGNSQQAINAANDLCKTSAWLKTLPTLPSLQTNDNNSRVDLNSARTEAAALWAQSIGSAKIGAPRSAPATPWDDLRSVKSYSGSVTGDQMQNRTESINAGSANTARNPFLMTQPVKNVTPTRRTHFQHDEVDEIDNAHRPNIFGNTPVADSTEPVLYDKMPIPKEQNNVTVEVQRNNVVEPMDTSKSIERKNNIFEEFSQMPIRTDSDEQTIKSVRSKLGDRLLKCQMNEDPSEQYRKGGYINNGNNSDDEEANKPNCIEITAQKYQNRNDARPSSSQTKTADSRSTLNTGLRIEPLPKSNFNPITITFKNDMASIKPPVAKPPVAKPPVAKPPVAGGIKSALQRRLEMHQQPNDENNNSIPALRLIAPRAVVPRTTINAAPTQRGVSRNFDSSVPAVDALPEIQDDDPVFWLNRPDFVTMDATFTNGKIPAKFAVDKIFKLYVSEINNPYKFWFNLEEFSDELSLLMSNMDFYYGETETDELAISEGFIKKDQICAAIYKGKWHRARIVAVYNEERQAKVFYVDYGTVDEIRFDQIRVLKKDFVHLPTQALRGCLDLIAPKCGVWKRADSMQFIELVQDKVLYARITHINYQEVTTYMILSETTHLNDVNVNEQMVLEGHAYQKDSLIHMHPKRPYCEVYPSFDMLENGEYPSFDEIGHMLTLDFDFHSYEESTIAPSMYGYSSY